MNISSYVNNRTLPPSEYMLWSKCFRRNAGLYLVETSDRRPISLIASNDYFVSQEIRIILHKWRNIDRQKYFRRKKVTRGRAINAIDLCFSTGCHIGFLRPQQRLPSQLKAARGAELEMMTLPAIFTSAQGPIRYRSIFAIFHTRYYSCLHCGRDKQMFFVFMTVLLLFT